MANDKLALPLQVLLAQAAKLPETGLVQKLKRRLQNASLDTIVLCDCSDSMSERVGAKTKADLMRAALIATDLPTTQMDHPTAKIRLIAFSSLPTILSWSNLPWAELPEPSGSTALHLALDVAARYRPIKTIVITDGHPDDQQKALAAADLMTGQIDCIFCGRDDDREAIAFLNQLARQTGGQSINVNLAVEQERKALPIAIKKLLNP